LAVLPAVQSSGGAVADPYRKPIKGRLWLWAGALLLVAAIGLGLGATGLLRKLFQPEAAPLRVQGSGNVGVKQAAQPTDTGVTLSAPPEPVTMPKDIRDWLEHLRRCEEERVSKSKEQLAAMFVTMQKLSVGGASEMLRDLMQTDDSSSMSTPQTNFQNDTEQLRTQWSDLSTKFNSLAPPPECRTIRDDYDRALRETGGMMVDIMGALSSATENPQAAIAALMNMQGKSENRIDAFAGRADDGVQALCDRYATNKWFKIVRDVTGGGLMQQFGGIPNVPLMK